MTSSRTGRVCGWAFVVCLLVTGCTMDRSGVQRGTGTASSVTPPASPPRASAVTPPARSPSPGMTNPGGLTDAQMVGQLFVGYSYGSSATDATQAQRRANLDLYGVATGAEIVTRWHLGGIILFDHNNLDPERPDLSTGNVENPKQISDLTAGLQRAAEADSHVRLLIGTDQEGGSVQRITNGVSWRPAESQIAHDDPKTLRCGYRVLGQQLLALGVNHNYAPVADVIRSDGGVIGDRSFSADPVVAARGVVAAVTGLQSAGVLATLKHWPGHGSTPVDSHESLPVLTQTKARWRLIDLPPFRAAAPIAGSVMVGHLALPALDPSGQPATLSPVLVKRELRQKLKYSGLIMTDSLWMAPMREAGTAGQVAVRAIEAGNDMLLQSPDLPAAYRAVLSRVRSVPAFGLTVRTAVRRILATKAQITQGLVRGGGC